MIKKNFAPHDFYRFAEVIVSGATDKSRIQEIERARGMEKNGLKH